MVGATEKPWLGVHISGLAAYRQHMLRSIQHYGEPVILTLSPALPPGPPHQGNVLVQAYYKPLYDQI
jgi:hypothetical protein